MLISYSHKFIFFHISKVAGLSIRDAIEPYATELDRFKIPRPPKEKNNQPNPLYNIWKFYLLHAKASDAQKELPDEIFNKFYKFAFVRNPWDWQISMYYFILKEKTHIRHQLVQSMKGFDEYLEWVIETKKPFPRGTTKLQKEVITDSEGNMLVDFVGKFETLGADFQQVCRTLGIEAALPHLNNTKHRDYRSYYNDKTKKMVAEHFKEDIETFEYHFDF
ncbi:MAG: sulfotransferase [SAR324 cluster bacterium]|uniref:Sulfotransferase n=1 Tax=SAR324 cluster bacterium TaxID=2024889 RepID=A0A2A4T516_9DELT|nr:MAG: sulfotransferase [SAR324 cluster bacterium]